MKRKGFQILHDGRISKSFAFSKEEREQLGLRGLLPYSTANQNVQIILNRERFILHWTKSKKYP